MRYDLFEIFSIGRHMLKYDVWENGVEIDIILSKFNSCTDNRSSCLWIGVLCTAIIYTQTLPSPEQIVVKHYFSK